MDGLLTAPSRSHFELWFDRGLLSLFVIKVHGFFTDSPSPDNIVIGNLECTFPFALEAEVSVVYWCVITSLEVGRERPLCLLNLMRSHGPKARITSRHDPLAQVRTVSPFRPATLNTRLPEDRLSSQSLIVSLSLVVYS